MKELMDFPPLCSRCVHVIYMSQMLCQHFWVPCLSCEGLCALKSQDITRLSFSTRQRRFRRRYTVKKNL